MSAHHSIPAVTVTSRAAQRLKSGHVWVYRSDISTADNASAGSLVHVRDERGRRIGSALYSSASQIAIRLLTSHFIADTDLLPLIHQRIDAAVAFREKRVANSDSYRVIFSEADLLPGLIIDRYNDVLVMQRLTQAFHQEKIREIVISALRPHFPAANLVDRLDPHVLALEQLPKSESEFTFVFGNEAKTVFHLNGIAFHFDGTAGQKTGAFLDQRENYAAAARYAHGEALDCFTYQGGFALHLARVCPSVTAVDASRPALEVAEQNQQLNRKSHMCNEIEWIEGNVFDLLKDYSSARRQYDTIVLDPPAFAKSKRVVATAARGYKELNLRALKMLRRGGILVTCSCSFHLSDQEFSEMLAAAAADAGRRVQVLEKRGAAIDHPALVGVPETHYLKCIIVQVIE